VFTHRPCRLFRRLPTVEFTGKIHEQVLASIGDAGLLCANLGGARILHFGYGQQMMADRGKLNRTLELIHKELEDDPDNSFHQFNLGNTLYVAGRMEEAVEAFSQCAENINPKQDFWFSSAGRKRRSRLLSRPTRGMCAGPPSNSAARPHCTG
jgi:tetratricopeptide (TPR) repeat protein